MQLKSAEFESAVVKRDFQGWLLFGPDQGRVSLLATALQKRYAGGDFAAVTREAIDVVRDPAVLADHLHGATLFAPASVLRLRGADDKICKSLEPFLAGGIGDGRLIVEAGELAGSSKLKKLFESTSTLAALPCWTPTEQELARRAAARFTELGVRHARGVPERMASLSPPDTGALLMECAKLAIYADGAELTTADVEMASSDHAEAALSDLSMATAHGDGQAALIAFYRLANAGESSIGAMRALQRHLQRLHGARSAIDAGAGVDSAMSALRPPVFWKEKAGFKAQVQKLGIRELESAIARLVEVERQIKSGGDEVPFVAQAILDTSLRIQKGQP